MIVDVEDFEISWEKSDKIKHKADFDDLIRAYEKLEKIESIVEEMWDENSYYNNSVRFAEKIEQIIKE